jgi:hypothetical protein
VWRHGGALGCVGLLLLQGCCGGGGGVLLFGVICVSGLGFCRAKAFTDISVGSNGDGVLRMSFSLLGAPLWSSLPRSTGLSG